MLVNNAGIAQYSTVEDQPIDDALLTLDTNVLGPLRTIRAVVPGMRSRGRGTIVNVSSVSGFVAVPFLGVYSASKAALESMSEVLAHEVQGAGIRVVIIQPGVFDTSIDAKSPAIPPSAALPGQAEASAQMRLEMAAAGPPTSVAARAIYDAVTADSSPLRVPVGDDAVMMTDLVAGQSGPEFYDTLHGFYGLA